MFLDRDIRFIRCGNGVFICRVTTGTTTICGTNNDPSRFAAAVLLNFRTKKLAALPHIVVIYVPPRNELTHTSIRIACFAHNNGLLLLELLIGHEF